MTPDIPGTWNDIAVDLARRGKMAAACAAARRAVDLAPDRADLRSNYGNMLRRAGKYEPGAQEIDRALKLDPRFVPAVFNHGVACMEQGEPGAAVSHFDWCLSQEEVTDWRFARASALLMAERWEEGFRDYECRELGIDRGKVPKWDGSPLKGRTLLLHAEQGLGDTIMFHRFAQYLFTKERTVNYIVHQPLARLLKGARQAGERLPADVHLPLMSLPHILGAIKVEAPLYIAPPFRLAVKKPPGTKASVGLIWKAKANKQKMTTDEFLHGQMKSMPLENLLELTRLPGVALFGLQPGSPDIDDLEAGHLIEDLGPQIGDMACLSAFMSQMDVIVSIDTAPAHLAGAMGIPTVVCMPFAYNWNWGLGDRSPWYESARIVRQKAPGVWPMDEICSEVENCLTAST